MSIPSILLILVTDVESESDVDLLPVTKILSFCSFNFSFLVHNVDFCAVMLV